MATLELYLLSFNCARNLINPHILAPHLFDALPKNHPPPDVIVLSLQEVAPIACAFLGGSLLNPYLERVIETIDFATKARYDAAKPYEVVIARHVGMTVLMVFAQPDIANQVKWKQSAGVGVGLWEMGNKGAVSARICLESAAGETELTFTAAHLAPFEIGVLRRNQDWENIVRNLVFSPLDESTKPPQESDGGDETQPLLSEDNQTQPLLSGLFKEHNHIFFAGDLNYRTSSTGPDPSDYLSFPQPGPDNSPQHFSKWLQRDQLKQEQAGKRTLQGLTEAPITFPPTYKYSHASAGKPSKQPVPSGTSEPESWSWSPRRFPSWCDRILFTPTGAKINGYTALPVQETSDHRPVALSVTVPTNVSEPVIDPPFPLNPQWKERRAAARRREFIVGVLAYLTMTGEGNAIVVGLLAGIVGGWFLIRAAL